MKKDSELFEEMIDELTDKCVKAKKIKQKQTIILTLMIILLITQLFVLKIGENNGINTVPLSVAILVAVIILAIIYKVMEAKYFGKQEMWETKASENS